MKTTATCRECGANISPRAPFGHCPKCLIALGFAPEPRTGTAQRTTSARNLSDYELLDQIGRGGMGIVYRARQISLKREVALKMIQAADATKPSAIERFHIEAEACAKLQHPNIVPIYDIGEEEGRCYFTMRLIEGRNLNESLSAFQLPRSSSLPSNGAAIEMQRKIARLMSKIAVAVHFAHERGILHRDLKPQNILIAADDEPFLTDFGLAKILDQNESMTESGAVLGTLNYIAPEQAAGGRISYGADVFSLGAILYELLTHTPPFRGSTAAETLRNLAENEAPDPRQTNTCIDRDLAIVCLKCLQKNPQERYITARELADDLERWLRNEPVKAAPISRTVRVHRWVRRNRAVTALLVSLVAGLATAVAFLFAALKENRAKIVALNAVRYTVSDILGQRSLRQTFIAILSEALTTLRQREPSMVQGAVTRLTLGVPVHQNHLATALQYADLVNYLEETVTKELRRPVRFTVRFYDEMTTNSLTRDGSDLMRINPWFYLEARSCGYSFRPLVRLTNATYKCVIVTRVNSTIKTLSDLRGRSLRFGEKNSTVTLLAKALLVQNDIVESDLFKCDYIQPQSSGEFIQGGYLSYNSDPLRSVVTGATDAAVALERQLEQSQYRNDVVVLKTFDSEDSFWAASPQAPPAEVAAVRHALATLHDSSILMGLPDTPSQPRGFVDVSGSYFDSVERARAAATGFDADRDRAATLPSGGSAGRNKNLKGRL